MTDERIISYLLEDLNEAERERFEEECFAADAWPDEIAAVEEGLIDSYLRRELTPGQRAKFEQNYLTTAARETKLINAAALLRHADERAAQTAAVASQPAGWFDFLRGSQWAWRVAFAVLAIAVLFGVWRGLRTAPDEIAANYPPPKTFTALALEPSVQVRSGDGDAIPKVKLPLSADALRVTLNLPPGEKAANYRVELDSAAFDAPAKLPPPVVENGRVAAVIHSRQLKPGQYVLKLYALENNAERPLPGGYYFDAE
jgi:hypothetical protein